MVQTTKTPPSWTFVFVMGTSRQLGYLRKKYPTAYLIDLYAWKRSFYIPTEEGDIEARRWLTKTSIPFLADILRKNNVVIVIGEFPSKAERQLYLQLSRNPQIHTIGYYFYSEQVIPVNASEERWLTQYNNEFELPSIEEGFNELHFILEMGN
ncbi:hypothetical protein [Bacillus bombysepticus]|uniref:hypothetical protein n=1 Tax=Bacillus bombysepticus TaxID=658666 RepID=UPI00301A3FEE